MKVALVYPEVLDLAKFKERRKEFPPFGVLYLASVLEDNDVETKIFKINPSNLMLDFRGFDAVGFSIPSSATYGLIKKCRFGSIYSNDPLIMVGGVHPNFYPESTLMDIKPHVVGVGEGEETIIELLKEYRSRDFSKINGVCYTSNGQPRLTPKRQSKKDIDYLPLPARHLLDESDFIMHNRLSNTDLRMTHVMFTRGCPFPCRFCAAARTRMQFRSGESARKELLHLIKEYNIDGFAIVDDNFIVNKKKVHDICESIKDLNLKWSALSRVDTIDQKLLEAMYDSGCIEIKFGMESGSPELLAAMDKKITLDQIRDAVKMTHSLGMKVKLFIIHGYPGENHKTTQETISILKELSPMIERVSLFRFVPLPGTFVYNYPDQFKLRNTDQSPDWDGDWSKYHIHHNNHHWWGTEAEFEALNQSYQLLNSYVQNTWEVKRNIIQETP